MKINFEVTNFTYQELHFDAVKIEQEMSHEEFIEMVCYYAEVFGPELKRQFKCSL